MSPGTIIPRCDTLYKQSARIIYSHRLTASLQCSVSGEVAAEAAAWPGRLRLPRRMWVTELLSSPSPHWDTFHCCTVDIYISTYLLYLVPLLTLSWAEGLVTCDGSQRQHFVAATSPILPPGELHRMLYPIFSNKSSVSASAARCRPHPSSSLLAPAMVNINK